MSEEQLLNLPIICSSVAGENSGYWWTGTPIDIVDQEPGTLRVKRLSPGAYLPERAHDSAGYDLRSPVHITIPARETVKVPLGFAAEFPRGYVALVWDRSSLGARGIHRFAGVIDSDYRGEWCVLLHNTQADFRVVRGDKIAQVLFQQVAAWDVREVEELRETSRGEGGFGSTGR